MNQAEKTKLFLKEIIISEAEIIKSIRLAIDSNSPKLITYFNQNSFNEYYKNPEFRKTLESNFKIFTDGIGMSFALKFLFRKKVNKFNATDLYTKLFDKFFTEKIPVYLIGGNYDQAIINNAVTDKINLCGYMNGYVDDEEIDLVIEKVRNSGARIIGVGMGTPRQEILALRISIQLKNCVILCVGNFFNFYLGITKRAPVILRNSGFEWLYRLFSEPKKLWKRYLIGIPRFMIKVISYKYL